MKTCAVNLIYWCIPSLCSHSATRGGAASSRDYPGYQRFFSRAAGIFGVGEAGHYKDLTEPETAREKSLAPRVPRNRNRA